MNNTALYQYLNQVVNKLGFDIRRFPARDQRGLLKYLKDNSISTCLDVGAGRGALPQMAFKGFAKKVYGIDPNILTQ